MNLTGKTIVLTGATSGVGREIAQILAVDNRVVALGRIQSKLDDLARCSSVIPIRADLTNPHDVEQAADQIAKQVPQVDILINNAAVQYESQFLDDAFSYELIQKEIQVNFTSVCQLTYLLLPTMLDGDPSIILNVNSGLGLAPKTSSAVYCATKGALNNFSLSLGYQLEEQNIKVLQAFLPLVDTPMTQGRGSGKITALDAAHKILQGITKEQPVNNIGKVNLLRLLLRVFPQFAMKMMKEY